MTFMTLKKHMKPCVVCGNDIPQAATYCTECESYQNWRRHMQFGLYTLPMLVALTAVMGSALPNISQWLMGHNSRLASAALRAAPSAVDLTVSNLGDRPGVADDVVLKMARLNDRDLPWATRTRPHTLRFVSDDSPVVPAGEVRKFRFVLAPGQDAAIDTPTMQQYYGSLLNEAVCHFVFTGTEFGGEITSTPREVPCHTTWSALFPNSLPLFSDAMDEVFARMRALATELDNAKP